MKIKNKKTGVVEKVQIARLAARQALVNLKHAHKYVSNSFKPPFFCCWFNHKLDDVAMETLSPGPNRLTATFAPTSANISFISC